MSVCIVHMYRTNIHVQKLSETLRDVHGNIGTWNNYRISNNISTSTDMYMYLADMF